MNRLIINTANDTLVIALDSDGKVFLKTYDAKMHHNEAMLPAIDELLKEHNLNIRDVGEFGVVIGPGSFTGIRVGIATIKAFRDALGAKAKGINNLKLLYNLAKAQNCEIETVAILGSRDSYFVGSVINDVFYIFERNLTLDELVQVSNNKPVAMYKADDKVNTFVVSIDGEILFKTFDESNESLIPVYYQLSQAESEKFKHGELNIELANTADCDTIAEIEANSITVNTLSKTDIMSSLLDDNYATIKAVFNGEIVGFLMIQFTDEASVVSVAVRKNYRNMGIASKMFEKSYDIMRERDINTISLEVKYDNITAYNLYKKLGFTTRRRRPHYYTDGQDCLEMVKTI